MEIRRSSKQRYLRRLRRRTNIEQLQNYIQNLPDLDDDNSGHSSDPINQLQDVSFNITENRMEVQNDINNDSTMIPRIVYNEPNFNQYCEVTLMAILAHGNLTLSSAVKFVNIINNLIVRFLHQNLKLPSVRALWVKQAKESPLNIFILCDNDHVHGPFNGEPKFFGDYVCENQIKKAEVVQGNYFIQIPLRYQLLKYLPFIQESMWCEGIFANRSIDSQNEIPVSSLTLTIHADEVMAFNSSSTKIFPIFASINELKPRFRRQYFFLLSLYVGSTKPSVKNYLTPICQELKSLFENPINWESPDNIKRITSFTVSAVIADAPMRAYLRHVRQYNHLQGCDWCLIQATSSNGARVYSNITEDDANLLKRNHSDFLEYEAYINSNDSHNILGNRRMNGITGVSPLMNLPGFNIVDGFAVEPMHCIVLGVFRSMINREWLQADSSSSVLQKNVEKNFFRKELSQRIMAIKVPSSFVRSPRSLDYIKFWKSSELDSLLCYYIICASRGLFQARYLNHLMCLTKIYHLSHVDSSDKIQQIKELVLEFQTGMAILYGSHMLTYNLHILSHLADSCKNLGPTSSYSSYPLENRMGSLKKSIRRASNVAPSLVRIFMSKFKFDDIIVSRLTRWNLSPKELIDFGCNSDAVTGFEDVNFQIPLITTVKQKYPPRGVKSRIINSHEELNGEILTESQIQLFDSVKIDNKRFSTNSYTMHKQRDDSKIRIGPETFIQIENIYTTCQDSNIFFAYGKMIRTKEFKFSFNGFTKTRIDLTFPYLHSILADRKESYISIQLDRKKSHVFLIPSTSYFYMYKNDFIVEPFLVNY